MLLSIEKCTWCYISAQQPVRYAFVRGASDGKKYVLLGGNTSLSVTDYKSPLQVSFIFLVVLYQKTDVFTIPCRGCYLYIALFIHR